MKDDYTTNSQYLTLTLLCRKVGRMHFLNLTQAKANATTTPVTKSITLAWHDNRNTWYDKCGRALLFLQTADWFLLCRRPGKAFPRIHAQCSVRPQGLFESPHPKGELFSIFCSIWRNKVCVWGYSSYTPPQVCVCWACTGIFDSRMPTGKQPLLTSITSCQTRQLMRIDYKAEIVTSSWRPWIKSVYAY